MRYLRKTKWVVYILFLFSNLGNGQSISIALKGGLFIPTTAEFSGPMVDAFNLKLGNKVDLFEKVGFLSVESEDMSDIANYRTAGAEIELSVHERLAVTIGMEFGKRSASSFFEARTSGDGYVYSRDYKLEISILPVYATVRYYFFKQDFNGYAGIGMGFYKVAIRGSSRFEELTESGEDLYWDAEGSALIPHLNVGVLYNFTRWLGIALDLRYVFGKIPEFEVKESENHELIGEPLLLPIGESASDKFEQKYRGLITLLALRLSF
jgi:outer membrane protein W